MRSLVSFQFDPRDFVFASRFFREFLHGPVRSGTRSFAEYAQLTACLRTMLLGSLALCRKLLAGDAIHWVTIARNPGVHLAAGKCIRLAGRNRS